MDEEEATLGSIREQLNDIFDPATTEEAQTYARRFLNKQLSSPIATQQGDLMTQMEKEAQEVRAVLKAAREKLAARRYNPADKWYALSAALGAPTRVGGVGDLASRAAGALQKNTQQREAFEESQQKGLLDYDTQMSEINQKILALKSGLLTEQGKIDADLAKESLKTLGKRVQGASLQNKAQQAVDREYAKDYLAWVQDGAPVAQKSLAELGQARDRLRGYRIDESGQQVPIKEEDFLTRQLGPTGRVAGAISTIPYAGKAIQDIAMPGGADIREMVEATVQGSLRPILGAQFTEKEGERLIARVYNPRMRPEVNAARVERLMKQIAEATRNKNAAARWFEEHGTLAGFQGKLSYTLNDFLPTDTNELSPESRERVPEEEPINPDDYKPAVGPDEKPPEKIGGKRVIDYRDLPKSRKKGPLGFAEGGAVPEAETVLVRMPDGRLVPVAADATQEEVDTLLAGGGEQPDDVGAYDPVLSRSALAALGAGAGYVGARVGMGLGTRAKDVLLRDRETPAQARLLRIMERENLSPSSLATDLRRDVRRGVPSMALDLSPNLRALAADSMSQAGPESLNLLDRLNARQAAARERALEQVNRGLKPDEYFGKEEELKTALYGDKARGIESQSAPLYRAAEQQFPAVRSKELVKLLDTPSGKKAVEAARKTMKDKGKPIGKANAVGMASRYSLEFLNQVKIELDDMISKEESKGATGRGKTLRDLRNAFRAEIDAATVDPQTGESPYKAARAQNELDRANLNYLQMGREKFGQMQPQEVSKAVSGMSFEQRDFFRTGVSQKISEMLNNPSTDINAARRLVGSPAMKEKLRVLFDSPNEFRVFEAALQREMDIFENSQGLLGKEESVRRRGAAPAGSRVQRGAQQAPSLGVFSPTHWALKYLRRKPEVSEKEAKEIVQLLSSGTPDEIARFEKRLGSKFGRKAARKAASSKAGRAAAALGAIAGATLGGGEEEPSPQPEEAPELVGLDPEDIEAAMAPAYAEGGKVGRAKQAIEELKARHSQQPVDLDYLKTMIQNIAMNTGESVQNLWNMFRGSELSPAAQMPIPAQPEKLAPFARSIDFEKARLKQIADSLDLRRDLSPQAREALNTSTLAANQAYDRMWKDPTYQNMQRLSELVRSLSDQVENKRRGGRINRQFGGMTRHA